MTELIAFVLAILAAIPQHGIASWYSARGLVAAAGPALRTGDWRGRQLDVSANGRTVRVTLTDWCQCYGSRLIDLGDDAFRQLAPLSRGILNVTIVPAAKLALPQTDVATSTIVVHDVAP